MVCGNLGGGGGGLVGPVETVEGFVIYCSGVGRISRVRKKGLSCVFFTYFFYFYKETITGPVTLV
jgi:CRISPR/Cas system-associated protein Csx1